MKANKIFEPLRQAVLQRVKSCQTSAAAAFALLLQASAPAHAVDGCLVLLCFAAPSWRSIPQCVPPITQVLRDLARGRAFPTCSMGGSANTASHAWSDAPTFCPPQYTHAVPTENGQSYYCDFIGAVSVTVNGQHFARTWWTIDGGTSTEFSPYAKAQLGNWNTRFDDDFAAWQQAQPPVTPFEAGN